MGWLANEIEQGIDEDDVITNSGNSTDHSILTFFGDIGSMAVGTYKWNGKTWETQ